ncbi:unnamed protein product [Leuciscus chuanchicus]
MPSAAVVPTKCSLKVDVDVVFYLYSALSAPVDPRVCMCVFLLLLVGSRAALLDTVKSASVAHIRAWESKKKYDLLQHIELIDCVLLNIQIQAYVILHVSTRCRALKPLQRKNTLPAVRKQQHDRGSSERLWVKAVEKSILSGCKHLSLPPLGLLFTHGDLPLMQASRTPLGMSLLLQTNTPSSEEEILTKRYTSVSLRQEAERSLEEAECCIKEPLSLETENSLKLERAATEENLSK